MENRELAIQIKGLKKMYKLGQIGGGSLQRDIQSWWARVRGKEDPNSKIGAGQRSNGKTFMALNGIDMTVYKGEALGIIGHNGAGKSTLLKLLSRVTAPTEGEIGINGRIASMLEVGTGFNGEMTGRENVYMNGTILGMSKAEIDAKMDQIIEFSEIGEFIDTPVKRYSSGMYVKLAFSVAAHLDSEIMIMDEVLAVGDMAFQKKCLEKMREAANQEGRTVLYVSHNMNTIRQLCDRCVVLDKGRVSFEGDVEKAIEIYSNKELIKYSSYVDLAKAEHFKGSNGKARMLAIEYIDKENACFNKAEKLNFLLKWHSNDNLEKLRFRIQVQTHEEIPVGVSCTSPICDSVKDIDYETRLSFDTSLLAEGKYTCSISLFQNDSVGNQVYVDHVYRAISFEVLPDTNDENRVTWLHRWWGSVQFPDVEILE